MLDVDYFDDYARLSCFVRIRILTMRYIKLFGLLDGYLGI